MGAPLALLAGLPGTALPPLPVALPLAAGAIVLILSHVLPRRVPDVIATIVSLLVALLCGLMALKAGDGPLIHWFGGWTPRDGTPIGIAFSADRASAGVTAFIGLLFTAAFVFAWGYFDEVHGHFHVLMLLFLAAMAGFCLTRDLFNLFVWFEVMSVVAFALTGYRLEESALIGALNFTVVNALASSLMLGGVGLIYARAGTLDFEAIARVVSAQGTDPVTLGAFALLASALLVKAAVVPFQFWLSDAHAVAPSPVSVIFSGAMVALGLFGLAKLCWVVFGASGAVVAALGGPVVWLGCATALIGGAMAIRQRHLKRMLAFSTISHSGIMLAGLGALSQAGTGGLLSYFVGHGLVKGALFMVAGILLATRASIDEVGLRGLGSGIEPAGVAMGVGGLMLAGLPLGLLDTGTRLVHLALDHAGHPAAAWALAIGAALTGAAVLRATGRIFLGWGAVPGEEARAPSEAEQEKADRPLWLMLLPCFGLLAVALAAPVETVLSFLPEATATFTQGGGAGSPVPGRLDASPLPWLGMALALLIAGFELVRAHLPGTIVAASDRLTDPPGRILAGLHSGLVADYVAWMMVGLAMIGTSLWLG